MTKRPAADPKGAFPFPTTDKHPKPTTAPASAPVTTTPTEPALDHGIEESFPASDPVSVSVSKSAPGGSVAGVDPASTQAKPGNEQIPIPKNAQSLRAQLQALAERVGVLAPGAPLTDELVAFAREAAPMVREDEQGGGAGTAKASASGARGADRKR
jgi:hypothetical protein